MKKPVLTISLDVNDGPAMYRLMQIESACGLESIGLKSRGGSVCALAKKLYGCTGTKLQVATQMARIVEMVLAARAKGVATLVLTGAAS